MHHRRIIQCLSIIGMLSHAVIYRDLIHHKSNNKQDNFNNQQRKLLNSTQIPLSFTSQPLYFKANFTAEAVKRGSLPTTKYLAIHDPTDHTSQQQYFAVQRQGSSTDCQKDLEQDGYCVLDIDYFGYSSHQQMYNDIILTEGKCIADKINQKQIINNHQVTPTCRNINKITGNAQHLHIDGLGGRTTGELNFWFPAVSNKFLCLIPSSVLLEGDRAIQKLLESDDIRTFRDKLETFGRIPDPGKVIIFWSISNKIHDPVIHGGVFDEKFTSNVEQMILIKDDSKTQLKSGFVKLSIIKR